MWWRMKLLVHHRDIAARQSLISSSCEPLLQSDLTIGSQLIRKSSEQRTPLWVGRHRVGTHPAQPILQQPMFTGAHKFYEELIIGPPAKGAEKSRFRA